MSGTQATSPEQAKPLLRFVGDNMEFSNDAMQALALLWGAANGGRRSYWENIVEELRFSPDKATEVKAEIDSGLAMVLEGVARGYLKNPIAA